MKISLRKLHSTKITFSQSTPLEGLLRKSIAITKYLDYYSLEYLLKCSRIQAQWVPYKRLSISVTRKSAVLSKSYVSKSWYFILIFESRKLAKNVLSQSLNVNIIVGRHLNDFLEHHLCTSRHRLFLRWHSLPI